MTGIHCIFFSYRYITIGCSFGAPESLDPHCYASVKVEALAKDSSTQNGQILKKRPRTHIPIGSHLLRLLHVSSRCPVHTAQPIGCFLRAARSQLSVPSPYTSLSDERQARRHSSTRNPRAGPARKVKFINLGYKKKDEERESPHKQILPSPVVPFEI